jgi:hypothetical protein
MYLSPLCQLPMKSFFSLLIFMIPINGSAETLVSGHAVFSIDQTASAASTAVTTLEAFFGSTESRSECLSGTGVSFTATNLPFPALPSVVSNPSGRTLQATTVDLDPADILGSWTPATSDFGPFVIGGEQIGLSGMTRWTGDFTGKLVFGDFALRYSPSRTGVERQGNVLSGLVLTSNIDFAHAAYADLANITITPVVNHQFTISGDLVYSDGFAALTSEPEDAGVDFGDFTFTGTFASNSPPQPSITILPSGLVELGFLASQGTTYRVQYSDNLSQWTTVTQAIEGEGNPVTWVDSGPPVTSLSPASAPKRFYRLFKE